MNSLSILTMIWVKVIYLKGAKIQIALGIPARRSWIMGMGHPSSLILIARFIQKINVDHMEANHSKMIQTEVTKKSSVDLMVKMNVKIVEVTKNSVDLMMRMFEVTTKISVDLMANNLQIEAILKNHVDLMISILHNHFKEMNHHNSFPAEAITQKTTKVEGI